MAVVVRVQVVLVEQTGSDLGEHHLRAGRAAVVVGILLVVLHREIFLDGHVLPLVICPVRM